MSWHAAGTYRIEDGRGGGGDGAQRFAPLNSWPDNANLDKARRLLWPVKQKYGAADLVGRPAGLRRQRRAGVDGLQDLRLRLRPRRTSGSRRRSSGARRTPGSATSATAATASSPARSAPCRWASSTSTPRARTATPTRWPSARDIRETFRRMAMNDEETVALIAGGHTFGKTPRRRRPPTTSAPSPRAARSRQQGLGWKSTYGTGKGGDTITSGLEVHLDHRRRRSGATASSRTSSATSGS